MLIPVFSPTISTCTTQSASEPLVLASNFSTNSSEIFSINSSRDFIYFLPLKSHITLNESPGTILLVAISIDLF